MGNVEPAASWTQRSSLSLLIHPSVCPLVLPECTEITATLTALLTTAALCGEIILLVEVRKNCEPVSLTDHDGLQR